MVTHCSKVKHVSFPCYSQTHVACSLTNNLMTFLLLLTTYRLLYYHNRVLKLNVPAQFLASPICRFITIPPSSSSFLEICHGKKITRSDVCCLIINNWTNHRQFAFLKGFTEVQTTLFLWSSSDSKYLVMRAFQSGCGVSEQAVHWVRRKDWSVRRLQGWNNRWCVHDRQRLSEN